MKNILVKVHGTNETLQEITVVTKDGQPTVVKAQKNVNYEFIDLAKNVAPDHIITKRVGNDLHISLEDEGKEDDLILEGFYDHEDSAALIGQAENGEYYYYIPDTGEVADYVTKLAINDVEGQALGGEAALAPWWIGVAAAGAIWPWLLGAAAIGGIAAAAGGSSDDSPAPAPAAPVAPVEEEKEEKPQGEGDGKDKTPPPVTEVPTEAPVREVPAYVQPKSPNVTTADRAQEHVGIVPPTKDGDQPPVINDDTPTFSGNALIPGHVVTVTVTHGETGVSYPVTTIVKPDGTWEVVMKPNLPEGTYTSTITVTDPKTGATSEPTKGNPFTLDTTPPATDSFTFTATDDFGTVKGEIADKSIIDDRTPTFSGKGTPGDTITITVTDVNDPSKVFTAKTVVDADGNWSVDVRTLNPNATYSSKVTATDPAGNTSEAVNGPTFTIEDLNASKQLEVIINTGLDGVVEHSDLFEKEAAPTVRVFINKLGTAGYKEGDVLKVTDQAGNELYNKPLTAEDLAKNQVEVLLPVPTNNTDVTVTATVGGDTAVATAQTDLAPAVVTAVASTATVNEGANLVTTVTLNNKNGVDKLAVETSGTADATDFGKAIYSQGVTVNADGTVNVDSTVESFTITTPVLADGLVEDAENITYTVGGVAANEVTINDVSIASPLTVGAVELDLVAPQVDAMKQEARTFDVPATEAGAEATQVTFSGLFIDMAQGATKATVDLGSNGGTAGAPVIAGFTQADTAPAGYTAYATEAGTQVYIQEGITVI
ncbi:Uncharacterised protein [Moraxella caviae]|uniref:Bacterial Ig-like domain-containing protein n=1 Tax=Moraxella caviae TaxID=34060 RepID=A0A378R3X1_9GAMM|nr:Ig-like domain-containing protein [Moraxella caviae]STZ09894.1 Uncharacterised protein [Moraxella caviae]VEW13230.1 Uncharacterised protein [Moraxella caviae]